MKIKANVEVNFVKIETKFARFMDDENLGLQLHNELARQLNPYVPMQTGMLSQNVLITPKYVQYVSPYAHYQYTGLVYGPNIPIIENGVITGWFSPPGKGTKHPTGKSINYSHELHPLATHHWDQAMLRDRKDEFIASIERIIKRWLKTNGKR